MIQVENNAHRTSYYQYFLPTIEIKDYNFLMDGQNVFDQPIKNNQRKYDKIWKIAIDLEDDYTTVELDFLSIKNYYEIKAIDKALDAAPKAIQQINFIRNLERDKNTTIFFIMEEVKETIIDSSNGTESIVIWFCLNMKSLNITL